MANMDDPEVVSRLSQEMAQALGQSLVKIGSEMQKLDRISRDAVSSSGGIGRLDSAFASIGTRLLGPVGLIAGLYQVSNALSGVAAQSVQMQAFSRNTGMASENVKDFQLQLQMMGKTSEEAKNTIASMNGILNNFATYKAESSLAQTMYGREGGAAFLNRLTAAKDRLGQIDEILKTYRSGNEQQKRGLADVFTGGDVDVLDRLVTRSEILRFTFQSSDAELRKYHESTVLFETNVSNAWKAVAGNAIAALNQITGGTEDSAKVFSKVVDIINKDTDSFSAKLKATIQEIRDLVDIYNDLSEGKFGDAASKTGKFLGFDSSKSPIANAPEDRKFRHFPWIGGGSSDSEPRYPQAEDPMGADYSARSRYSKEYWNRVYRLNGYGRGTSVIDGDGTSGATDFSGMRRTQSIEEDQSKTLVDIRDILQRMEGGASGGSGGGGGGGGSYPGSAGLAGGGRGTLGGQLGMYTGRGTAGVGSDRGRVGRGGDPRGMEGYIRETAAKYGIDPDTAVAVAKSEGLATFQSSVPKSGRGSFNGREDSWGAFQLYMGGGLGNEFQKETGLDPRDPANEKATIDYALKKASTGGWGPWHGAKNTGIGPWAGIGRNGIAPQPGGDARSSPFSGMSFGGDVRERQRTVANVRKGDLDPNLRTAFDYASSKTGLTVDVTSGGQRMHGAPGAVGSHRHDNGNAGDFNLRDADGKIVSPNDPRALEFYRYTAQAGVTGGGHSYMSDPNKIHLDRSGGVYAGGREFRDAIARGQRETDVFAAAARARMDAAKNSGTENSLKATVDFNNVPSGVKTSVETEGEIFKDLQVSKSRQNEVAGGSPGQPFAGVW